MVQEKAEKKTSVKSGASKIFLFGSFFDPEDEGNMFLRMLVDYEKLKSLMSEYY
jgi:predicted nucleotidyltransferase